MQPVLAATFLFATVIVISRAVVISRARSAAARAALEIELRIIDKLESADAIAQYLAASPERPLTAALSTRSQADRAIEAIQIAIILFAAGFGLLALGTNMRDPDQSLVIFGVMGIALSVGFAAVAIVTRKLVAQWTKPSSPRSI